MKKYTDIFTVLKSEYLNCSANGNPKKRLVLSDDAGHVLIATTGTDCLCGYMSYYHGKKYKLTHHYTKNFNMVIDYAEEV
jgi:hypothetical protein